MFDHGSYVYYVCPIKGINFKRIVRESDMLLFSGNKTGMSFNLNGCTPGYTLPQLLPSTVHVYKLLCELYGVNAVPKPIVTLTGLELLVYMCENKSSSSIKCIHNSTKSIVKIFDVIGNLAININSKENYFWHELTPITNDGVPIASVDVLYQGEYDEI